MLLFAGRAHLTPRPWPCACFTCRMILCAHQTPTQCPLSLLTTLRAPSRPNGVTQLVRNIVRRLPIEEALQHHLFDLFPCTIKQPWCVARNKCLPFPLLPRFLFSANHRCTWPISQWRTPRLTSPRTPPARRDRPSASYSRLGVLAILDPKFCQPALFCSRREYVCVSSEDGILLMIRSSEHGKYSGDWT